MKKGNYIVLGFVFSIILSSFFISSQKNYLYKNNFESYLNGNVISYFDIYPQHPSNVKIIEYRRDKSLQINSLSPVKGDRDNHITFNKEYKKLKNEKLIVEWKFKVTDCNQSWRQYNKVVGQASNIYLFYSSPKNFIDVEYKIYATNTSCGSGKAQISSFKRINGKSTPLINYTTYNFVMDKSYNPQVKLEKYNSTNYKLSIYLNNELMTFSNTIYKDDFPKGKILLENAGTITEFDDVVIKRY